MNSFHADRELYEAGWQNSEQLLCILREIEANASQGKMMALTGGVCSGKTTTLSYLRKTLAEKGEVGVAQSLSIDKEHLSLATLMLELFYDLAMEKGVVVPNKLGKRELALRELIKARGKPVILFIDDAHDLPKKTLADLAQFMERIRSAGCILSVVLAGKPGLQDHLGDQAMLFPLENTYDVIHKTLPEIKAG